MVLGQALIVAGLLGAPNEDAELDILRTAIESRFSAISSLEVQCTVLIDRSVARKRHPDLSSETVMEGLFLHEGGRFAWEFTDEVNGRLQRHSFDGKKEYVLVRTTKPQPNLPLLRISERTGTFPSFTPAEGIGLRLFSVPLTIPDVIRQTSTRLATAPANEHVEFVSPAATTDGVPVLVHSRFDPSRGLALQRWRIVCDPDHPDNVRRFKTIPTDKTWFQEMEVQEWGQVAPADGGAPLMFPMKFVVRQSGGVDIAWYIRDVKINHHFDSARFRIEPTDGMLLQEIDKGRLIRSVVLGTPKSIDRSLKQLVDDSHAALGSGASSSRKVDARVPATNRLRQFAIAVAIGSFLTLGILAIVRVVRRS